MNIETARGVAARIWGDPDYSHVVMDVKLAEEIAYKLLECAQQAAEAGAEIECVCDTPSYPFGPCSNCGGLIRTA